jgi:hypothetical protein
VVASVSVLVAVNLYLFRDHWRGSSSFTYDFPMAYYAFISDCTTSLQMGEWPHWIPYQSMGYPAALNPQLVDSHDQPHERVLERPEYRVLLYDGQGLPLNAPDDRGELLEIDCTPVLVLRR